MSTRSATLSVLVTAVVLALVPFSDARASERTLQVVVRGEMTIGQYLNRLDFDPAFTTAQSGAGTSTVGQLLNRCDFAVCPPTRSAGG